MKKSLHYLLILIGLLILLIINQPIAAGICLLLGIVIVFEKIWPEKWGAESK